MRCIKCGTESKEALCEKCLNRHRKEAIKREKLLRHKRGNYGNPNSTEEDGAEHWVLIDTNDLEIMPDASITIYKDHSGYYARYRNGRRMERLHRRIMGFPEGLQIDHWNHDTLDNRRQNLRVVTNQMNDFNRNVKGYTWHKVAQKWKVQIKINRKDIYLGLFEHEADAGYQYLLAKEIIHAI